MLDIFNNNAFHVTSLSLAMTQLPFTPGLIGELNLFREERLTTTSTAIEVRGERLALVPERPRGAPPTPDTGDPRAMVSVNVPHFPVRSSLLADSVQNVRAFGSEDQLEAVMNVVTDHESRLGRRLDLTLEYLRLGAVKGVITTAADRETGAPLQTMNLFTTFGVAPQAVTEWPIIGAGNAADATAWQGQLTTLVNDLGRRMADAMSGGMYQQIYGVCGSVFFDAFQMHPERRQPFLYSDVTPLLRPMLGSETWFRDVRIREYRGQVGAIRFVQPDECHFFPVGAPDLFVEFYSPGDYNDAVNRTAMPRYAKLQPMDFDKGYEMEAQMNVLPICATPRALFTAKATAFVPTGAAAPATARR